MLKELFPDTDLVRDPETIKNNIIKNILLAISAFMYFIIYVTNYIDSIIFLVLTLIVLSQISGIREKLGRIVAGVKIFSAISAFGICVFTSNLFLDFSSFFIGRESILSYILYAVYFLIIFPFVFTAVTFFTDKLLKKLSPVFSGMSKAEWTVYSILLLAAIVWSVIWFIPVSVFSDTDKSELIYTADTGELVAVKNCFLTIDHHENDIRQPLFAIFASPIVGPAYLLGLPLSLLDNALLPLFINCVQLVPLFVGVIMLSFCLELDKYGRIVFVTVFCFSYSFLLFSVMTEQYIIVCFWLSLLIYERIRNGKADRFVFVGAAGTLITSALYAPLTSENFSFKNIKKFIRNMIGLGATFLFSLMICCRTSTILDSIGRISKLLNTFGKKDTTLYGRLCQYTHFISDCFTAPSTMIFDSYRTFDMVNNKYELNPGYNWQLSSDHSEVINIIGIIILVICVLSIILNFKQTITKIAAVWVGFSAVLLVIVGWGAPENGMVLYSLYFCWAFYILLFQLVKFVADKLKNRFIIPAVGIASAAAMTITNYPALTELYGFALQYYPR